MRHLRWAIFLTLAALAAQALAVPVPPKQPAGPNLPNIPVYQNQAPVIKQQPGKRDSRKKNVPPARHQRPERPQRPARPANGSPANAAPAVKGVVAPEFRINTDSLPFNYGRNYCAAAMQDDGTVISVWADGRTGYDNIYFQHFSRQGLPLGPAQAADAYGTSQEYPAVAVGDNGAFAIVWDDYRADDGYARIYCRSFDAGGNPLGGSYRVDDYDGISAKYRPAITATDSGFAVDWEEWRNGLNYNVHLRLLDTLGVPLGTASFMTGNTSNDKSQVDISRTGQGFVATWYDRRSGKDDIYARIYSDNGDTIGPEFMVNDSSTYYRYEPRVCGTDSGFTVVWYDYRSGSYYDIYLQRYDTLGAALGVNFQVTSTIAYAQTPSIAHRQGQTVVSWYDDRNGDGDVFAQWFKPNGDTLGGQVMLNDDASGQWQYSSKAVAGDSGWAFVWMDQRNISFGNGEIYGQGYDTTLSAIGANFFACDSIFGLHDQYDPSVAAGQGGNFLAVWYDYRFDDGSGNICDVFGRLYDQNGNALTPDFLLSDTAYNSGYRYTYDPKAACLADGSYLVAWYDYRNDNDYDIYGQRLDASGNPVGGNYLVSGTAAGYNDYNLSIASDDSGYGVFWYAYDPSWSNPNIYGRLFRTNGDSIGSTCVVTDTSASYPYAFYPCAAATDSGLVVVWEEYLEGNNNYYIYGRRMLWDGSLAGGRIVIGDSVDADQYEPSIAGTNGGFLAAWYDYRAGNYAVFGQYLDAAGQKVDTNFMISTDPAFDQEEPSVAVSPDGSRYAVTWYGYNSSNNRSWLVSQRYLGGLPQGGNEVVIDSLNWSWLYTWGASNLAATGDRLFFTFYGKNGTTGSDVFGKVTDWYATSQPPTAIAKIFPPNDTLLGDSTVSFTWTNATAGTYAIGGYQLQVSADSGLSTYCLDTLVADTSFVAALPSADTIYYWRVRALDIYGYQGPATTAWNLEIDVTNPAIPSLALPADNSWQLSDTVVCSWGEVAKKASPAAKASEVSYIIQLDTNNTFAAPIIEDTTTILLDSFSLSEGRYYWRVMAYDAAGNYGTYSSFRTFGIDTTAPDIQYVLDLDDDDSAPYGPYEVTSKVYDLSGVKTAWLFQQVNGGSWDSTAMFSASDSLRDSIPEFTPATDETVSVSYYLKVTDMLDHQSISTTYSFKAIGPSGVTGRPTASLPTVYALQNAYPNPSRGQTIFKYQLPKESKVSLTVYNVVGQAVKRFDIGSKPAGYHQVNWNANTLPNGIYFYQLKAGAFSSTRKLMVVR